MQLEELAIGIETSMVIIIGLWRKQLNKRGILLIAASYIFFAVMPLTINLINPSTPQNPILEFTYMRDAWLTIYRSSTSMGLALAVALTARNIIATVILAGANVPIQQYYYGLEAVGQFLDPLSFIVYTAIHLSQVMLAVFNTTIEIAYIAINVSPFLIAIALPLMLIGKTRTIGATLLVIALTAELSTNIAAASIQGLRPPSFNLSFAIPSQEPMDLLYTAGGKYWLLTGYIGRHELILYTPTSISPVPSGEITINASYYLWLKVHTNIVIKSLNGIREVILQEPPFNPVINGDQVVGAWELLNSTQPTYVNKDGAGYVTLSWVESLKPNETQRWILWTYGSNITINGCNHILNDSDVYEEARVKPLLNKLSSFYENIANQLNINNSVIMPPPNPPSDLTQRIAIITCTNKENQTILTPVSITIMGSRLYGWGPGGIGNNHVNIAYTTELSDYYEVASTANLRWLENQLRSMPNIFGLFVVKVMVYSATLFGAINALAFVLGMPTAIDTAIYSLVNGLFYELSIIFLFKPSYGSTSISRKLMKRLTGKNIVAGERRLSTLRGRSRRGELHRYLLTSTRMRRAMDGTTLTLMRDGAMGKAYASNPRSERVSDITSRYVTWSLMSRSPRDLRIRLLNDTYSYMYASNSSIVVLRSRDLLVRFIRYAIAARINEISKSEIEILHAASKAVAGDLNSIRKLGELGFIRDGAINWRGIERVRKQLSQKYNWLGTLYGGGTIKTPRDPILHNLVNDYMMISTKREPTVLQAAVRLKVTPLIAVMMNLGQGKRGAQHEANLQRLINEGKRQYIEMSREAARISFTRARTGEKDLIKDDNFSLLYIEPANKLLHEYRQHVIDELKNLGLRGNTVHEFIMELRKSGAPDPDKAVNLISELRRIDSMIKSLEPGTHRRHRQVRQ